MRFSQTDWKPRNMYKVFCFIAFGPGSFTFPAPGHFVFVFLIEFVWLSSRISFAKFVTMNITKSFNFNVNVLEGGGVVYSIFIWVRNIRCIWVTCH